MLRQTARGLPAMGAAVRYYLLGAPPTYESSPPNRTRHLDQRQFQFLAFQANKEVIRHQLGVLRSSWALAILLPCSRSVQALSTSQEV